MDMEITFDPLTEAARAGLELDKSRHYVLPDDSWIRWVRRTFKLPNLFVYHHLEQDAHVLALWIVKPRFFVEVDAWDPETEERPAEAFLSARFRSIEDQKRDTYRHLKAKATKRRLDLEEKAAQRKEVVKFLRRRGIDDGAARWEAGAPFATKKEAGPEMVEFTSDLVSKAKGRIITSG